MLAINYKTNLKAKGFDLREQGVIQSGKTIGKTVLLAVLAACCTIGIVFFAAYFFNTNFQFWAIMFRTFTADKVPYMLIALPMFLLFYIPNSIACHSFRFNKVGGKANVFIVALFNAASIIYIEIVQYSVFFATGQPFWYVESFDRQLGGWLLSTVVVMFVTPFIARKIYKETKNPLSGRHPERHCRRRDGRIHDHHLSAHGMTSWAAASVEGKRRLTFLRRNFL